MIAVDGFDEFDVSSTGFSVWQSPVSGLIRKPKRGSADFCRVMCGFCGEENSCGLGTYDLRGAVVGVDDSNGGDEEVISTAGAVPAANRDHVTKLVHYAARCLQRETRVRRTQDR
jgi:hypothetical protein